MGSPKKSEQEIALEKSQKTMNTIAERCAYYRANPQRFCSEFLGLNLKLFQKIIIWAMMHFDVFAFIACRGIGKTYLVALYSTVRAILYPGSKIVCASFTFKQSKEIILKITDDFMHKSPLLCNEIQKVQVGQNECNVYFKNGSFIKAVIAGETARGTRSNCLIIDESRLVSQKIVDTILRPMNASPRQPGYLNKPEYVNLSEMNQEMHLSSAYYAASELFEKVKTWAANMLDPSFSYFVCDLPYSLSIKEGLLMRQQITNEMSEATFSDITFAMERCGLFYSSAEDALFDFKILNDKRILTDAFYPLEIYKNTGLNMPDKKNGEKRVLSVDVALLASKKHDNDASAIEIHQAIPTSSNNYMDNICGLETKEGLTTDELGLIVMRSFYQYNCDYIALDCTGIGISILDYIMADRYDPLYGCSYGALTVVDSNDDLADRCKVSGAPRIIYTIHGNSRLNNDIALGLRAGFQNGYINLLISENNAEDALYKIKGYSKMSDSQKDLMRLPYVQTTLLINELINLNYETSNGLIKVREKSGMRKDRYSSTAYGYYVVQELGKKLKPKTQSVAQMMTQFTVRAPKKIGAFR